MRGHKPWNETLVDIQSNSVTSHRDESSTIRFRSAQPFPSLSQASTHLSPLSPQAYCRMPRKTPSPSLDPFIPLRRTFHPPLQVLIRTIPQLSNFLTKWAVVVEETRLPHTNINTSLSEQPWGPVSSGAMTAPLQFKLSETSVQDRSATVRILQTLDR